MSVSQPKKILVFSLLSRTDSTSALFYPCSVPFLLGGNRWCCHSVVSFQVCYLISKHTYCPFLCILLADILFPWQNLLSLLVPCVPMNHSPFCQVFLSIFTLWIFAPQSTNPLFKNIKNNKKHCCLSPMRTLIAPSFEYNFCYMIICKLYVI